MPSKSNGKEKSHATVKEFASMSFDELRAKFLEVAKRRFAASGRLLDEVTMIQRELAAISEALEARRRRRGRND